MFATIHADTSIYNVYLLTVRHTIIKHNRTETKDKNLDMYRIQYEFGCNLYVTTGGFQKMTWVKCPENYGTYK